MIVEPELRIADFIKAGADIISVHAEPSSTIHLHRTLNQVCEEFHRRGPGCDRHTQDCDGKTHTVGKSGETYDRPWQPVIIEPNLHKKQHTHDTFALQVVLCCCTSVQLDFDVALALVCSVSSHGLLLLARACKAPTLGLTAGSTNGCFVGCVI